MSSVVLAQAMAVGANHIALGDLGTDTTRRVRIHPADVSELDRRVSMVEVHHATRILATAIDAGHRLEFGD